jgi:hypothetical protein
LVAAPRTRGDERHDTARDQAAESLNHVAIPRAHLGAALW